MEVNGFQKFLVPPWRTRGEINQRTSMFISITHGYRHWYGEGLDVGWMQGGGGQWGEKRGTAIILLTVKINFKKIREPDQNRDQKWGVTVLVRVALLHPVTLLTVWLFNSTFHVNERSNKLCLHLSCMKFLLPQEA